VVAETRHSRPWFATITAAIAVAGAALSACASTPTPGPATASVTSSGRSTQASARPSASVSAGAAPTVVPTVPSAGTGAEVTLRGTVREGVEANCVVLEDDNGIVLANLLGDNAPDLTAALAAGAKVQVTGSFLQGVMTTCQQGPPFQVTAVKAL